MKYRYAIFYILVITEEVIMMYYIMNFCEIYAPVVDRWIIGVVITFISLIIIEFAITLVIGGLRAAAKLQKKL